MASRLYPAGMIFSAIILLVLPGVIFNVFGASGLDPAFNLSCPGYPNVTCQNSYASGCQADPSQCTLQGTSISILNQNSPFTDLIHGQLGFFVSVLTGAGLGTFPSQSIWQVTPFGSSNLYSGECKLVYSNGEWTDNSSVVVHVPIGYSSVSCTQVNSNGVPVTQAQAFKLSPAPYYTNQTAVAFYNLAIGNASFYNSQPAMPYQQSANCIPMVGFFFEGTNQNFIAGCQYYHTNNHITTYYYYAIETNVTAAWTTHLYNGAEYTYKQCNDGTYGEYSQTACPPIEAPVVIQPETWDVFNCDQEMAFPQGTTYNETLSASPYLTNPYATPPIIPQCNAVVQSISNFTTASNASGLLGTIFLWLASIVLLIVSSGISFQSSGSIFATGVSVGAGVNSQGTRFAQVMGAALFVYVPMYSEFSSWFTSGILPNGLDGSLGVISLVISALLFGGVIWLATEGTSN